MKSRHLLYYVASLCIGLLGIALFMQHVKGVETCPLCVLQRYAFFLLALVCLIGAILNAPRICALFGFVTALAGGGIAAWQVWFSAKPGVSCGIDPLETVINKLITAKWLPMLFYADGSCAADTFRLFGLSVPQWSLVWFALFALVTGRVALRRTGR